MRAQIAIRAFLCFSMSRVRGAARLCNPTPPLSRPVPKPVLSLLSVDSNSFFLAAAPALSDASYLSLPLSLSVLRVGVLLSSSSPSRLFYGKEGGSERTDGRSAAARRPLASAAPVGVGHCMRLRCGQSTQGSGFLVQFEERFQPADLVPVETRGDSRRRKRGARAHSSSVSPSSSYSMCCSFFRTIGFSVASQFGTVNRIGLRGQGAGAPYL